MSERIPESELIINADGSVFHLHILPEDLADNVILVGDPGRVEMVASFLDEWSITVNKSSREFVTVTGRYKGVPVTVLSTGIGTDNIDIVMTELDALANIDFDTRMPKEESRSLNILRIGTCGAIRPEIPLGGYIFSEMSCGFDGLLNWYTEGLNVIQSDIEDAFIKYMNWPGRLATPYFVKSSEKIRNAFKDSAFMGITMSAPGFYGPQGRSVRARIAIPDLVQKLEGFEFEGHHFTNIEMESSALEGLAGILGHNAGTICLAIANRHAKDSNPDSKPLMEGLVEHALEAITSLDD